MQFYASERVQMGELRCEHFNSYDNDSDIGSKALPVLPLLRRSHIVGWRGIQVEAVVRERNGSWNNLSRGSLVFVLGVVWRVLSWFRSVCVFCLCIHLWKLGEKQHELYSDSFIACVGRIGACNDVCSPLLQVWHIWHISSFDLCSNVVYAPVYC